MKPTEVLKWEAQRLQELDAHAILQTPPEAQFDESVRLAAYLCGVPISGMTLVSADRQWFKALYGDMPRDLPRSESFCVHTLNETEMLEVEDALLDPRFAGSPLVTSYPMIRFYAGAPLRSKKGLPLGSLCVIDQKPRKLTPFERRGLSTVAAQVSEHLELRLAMFQLLNRHKIDRERIEILERKERERAELTRMLVHDMKSPLTAVIAAGAYLATHHGDAAQERVEIAHEIIDAGRVLHRIVSDLLDIERADAGLLKLTRQDGDLHVVVQEVVSGLTRLAAQRGQRLELVDAMSASVAAFDHHLIARLLMNLIDNALKYGPGDTAVRVELSEEGSEIISVRVIDRGSPIPEGERELIFEPHHRLQHHETLRSGHGLGLAFCKRVAELHGGTLHVEPGMSAGNAFVLRLPRR